MIDLCQFSDINMQRIRPPKCVHEWNYERHFEKNSPFLRKQFLKVGFQLAANCDIQWEIWCRYVSLEMDSREFFRMQTLNEDSSFDETWNEARLRSKECTYIPPLPLPRRENLNNYRIYSNQSQESARNITLVTRVRILTFASEILFRYFIKITNPLKMDNNN
jgi:hypothetical protein